MSRRISSWLFVVGILLLSLHIGGIAHARKANVSANIEAIHKAQIMPFCMNNGIGFQ
jgi:hypothetical protein